MTDADVRKRCEDILITQLSAGVVDVTDGEMMIYRAAYADGMEQGAVAVEGLYLKPPRILDADTLETCIETIRQAARGESPTTNKGE